MAGDFKLSCNYNNPPFNSEFRCYVIVTNVKNAANLESGLYLEFKGNSYFSPERVYVGSENPSSCEICLTVYGNKTIVDLPSNLKIDLFNYKGEQSASINILLSVDYFTGDFMGNLPCQLNILLFGVAGAAKSSFINSCYNMLNKDRIDQIAQAGGNASHVTRTFKRYTLQYNVASSQPKDTFINLLDTWGVDKNNYTKNEFLYLLHGQLGEGWRMEDQVRLGFSNRTNTSTKPHCVLFFIPFQEIMDDNANANSYLQRIKSFIDLATEAEVPVTVAITKLDLYCAAFRQQVAHPPKEIETVLDKAAAKINIHRSNVVPLLNYWKEPKNHSI